MKLFTVQAAWRNYRLISVPVDHVINVLGDMEFPNDNRAALMCDTWIRVRKNSEPGILWLAPDVALDPVDLEAMHEAVAASPEDVHTGMVKLWPISTGHNQWIWSHRPGTMGQPAATQDGTAPVAYFSMDCLWAPARLLDLSFPAGREWYWSSVDVHMSEIALEQGIRAHAVPGCQPKHLHFSREHETDGRANLPRESPV